jgi:hypothetical protein
MPCRPSPCACWHHPRPAKQQGAALLLAIFIAIILSLAFFFRVTNSDIGDYIRDQKSDGVLLQAKEALIGNAVSARRNYMFGFLPVPDLGNTRNSSSLSEGNSAGNFSGNAKDLSVIGRLPWRTLGVAPLKDVNAECLWYAVSGSAKSALPPDVFNWDTIGHFDVFKSDGTAAGTLSTSAGNYHERPWALVFAAGPALAGQDRSTSATDIVPECSGNYDVRNYLDTYDPDANIQGIVNYFPASTNNATGNAATLALPKAVIAGNVDVLGAGNKVRITNDRVLAITAKDIFDRIKNRSDFKADIDTLLNDLTACLNAIAPGALPVASNLSNKGIDNIIAACPASTPLKAAILANWKDNLLYAGGPSGNFTISNNPGACKAILLFAGERTTRTVAPLVPQTRATPAQKGDGANAGDPAMYLEGANANQFPANGAYTGAAYYATGAPSADVVRCITGAGAAQVSFSTDLPNFINAGATDTLTMDVTENSVTLSPPAAGAGTAAACLWSPVPIPLLGKTLRAYYEYQFKYSDTYATTGAASDRGNGMTFQLVKGDNVSAPNACGSVANLGALNATNSWGQRSYIVETDLRNDAPNDPSGNHTAIMLNGDLAHAAGETQVATLAAPCKGGKSSCQFFPANTFEEEPRPIPHNQRIEIHTGCNAGCTRCTPAGTDGYAKISVWVDCADCSDVTTDFAKYIGSEFITLLANRDFSAPGDWTGSNWSWSAGAFNHTPGATAALLPSSALSAPPSVGTSYQISLTVSTISPGDIVITFGGNSTAALTQDIGTASYILQFDPSSTASLAITPDANWTGSISSASIRAFTPAQINRCVTRYDPEMRQAYFGLTAGFTGTPETSQSVTIKNLYLRSD